MRMVVDASVVVKWALPLREEEAHVDRALALLDAIEREQINLIQPAHWLAEVVAVLSRLSPDTVKQATTFLQAMEFPIASELEVYHRASALAQELDAHVFDTLYHAVALEWPETSLVTADERYYRKAKQKGAIQRLSEWTD